MYICLPILFFIQNVGVAFNVTGSREFFLYHRYHLHGGLQCKLNVTFMFRSFVINVHYNYIFFCSMCTAYNSMLLWDMVALLFL